MLGTLRGAGEGTKAGTTNRAATKSRGRKELRAMILKASVMNIDLPQGFAGICSPPCTSYSWPDLSMKRRQLLLEVYQLKERNGSKIIKFDQNILQNILYNV